MVISDSIFAMLLTYPKFSQFTKKDIADATKTTEVLIALDAENREAVEDMVRKAVEAGGSTYADAQDHGWMYQHSFADLDGTGTRRCCTWTLMHCPKNRKKKGGADPLRIFNAIWTFQEVSKTFFWKVV